MYASGKKFTLLVIFSISMVLLWTFYRIEWPPTFKSYKVVHKNVPAALTFDVHSSHWIVVTTILGPTDDVKFLAGIYGWKVVVVGDAKTPRNWNYPNCTFLSLPDQERLGFRILSLLPTGTYSRKNIGYLFAIAHGAMVIYETDDDNRPLDGLKSFALSRNLSGLVYVGGHVFNPYAHFGQSSLWPRGYPLELVGSKQPSKYVLGSWPTPLIQQGLVNGDPDMDAIFRLTRKTLDQPLNVTFDSTAPNVILSTGVLAPFNSQNTLHLYKAFWSLLLPITTSFRVCDIWRSYWAQRLLWEIGGSVAFMRPNAYQRRNAHDYLEDAVDEEAMYWNTTRLLNFLSSWTCPPELPFSDCILTLSSDMEKAGFWGKRDVTLIEAWLEDLLNIGYEMPERINSSLAFNVSDFYLKKIFKIDSPFEPSTQMTRVQFYPVEMAPPLPNTDMETRLEESERLRQIQYLQRLCKNATFHLNEKHEIKHVYQRRTLLVVEFNFPFYDAIPFLETNNRHRFPTMLYCGDDIKKFLNMTANSSVPMTFIEADVVSGIFGYECMIHAIRMNYNVDAYLYLSEDVLVNFWNLPEFAMNETWQTQFVWDRDVSKAGWSWWNYDVGIKAIINAITELSRLAEHDKQVQSVFQRVKTNHRSYMKSTNYSLENVRGCGDIFQVSVSDSEAFLVMAEVLRKHRVFLEVAVHFILTGLQGNESVRIVPGLMTWSDRENVTKHYKPNLFWLHPVKWRLVFQNTKYLQYMCERYYTFYLADV